MRRTLILGYRDWVFRDNEEEVEKILKNLFREEILEFSELPNVVLAKRTFDGTDVNFLYYSPTQVSPKAANHILNEIRKDVVEIKHNIVILLHAGSGITFFDTPETYAIAPDTSVKIFFFSGEKDEMVYHKLLNTMGTFLNESELTKEGVEATVNEVWEEYFIKRGEQKAKNLKKIDR